MSTADNHDFPMPWEHKVCSACFEENPYAIWLIKQQCFSPHAPYHRQSGQVTVAIDTECMKLVKIASLPPNYQRIGKNFIMCRRYRKCLYDQCRFRARGRHYAHSKVEADTWNIKKRFITTAEGRSPAAEVTSASLRSQSPSEVCQTCLQKYTDGAIWLAWLECIHPEEHIRDPTKTVVVSSSLTKLVTVRSLPPESVPLDPNRVSRHCPNHPTCGRRGQCFCAHSEEEFNYWKWQCVNKMYMELATKFKALLERYQYPREVCVSKDLQSDTSTLSRENYVSKYHKLVYLDELAHSRKMIKECNGTVQLLQPLPREQQVRLKGMTSAAIDYAIHGHATVELTLPNKQKFTATIAYGDYTNDVLVVEVLSHTFFHTIINQRIQQASAHFEINHRYFRRLQQAIQHTSANVLRKLVPPIACFHSRRKQAKPKLEKFPLDQEYQLKAFQQMLSCSAETPYLLLGPFGTGKTYILAAVAVQLLKDPNSRILIATHQNIAADSLYRMLQMHVNSVDHSCLRLVAGQQAIEQVRIDRPCSCSTLKGVNPQSLARWPAIITTFLTALNLKEMEEREKYLLNFTHILVDEGAQSREPEALGALVLAKQNTKIIIVGDNQQIGPQVAVLSDAARENGLGSSLVERLFGHYKDLGKHKIRSTTLLTNYRSHPSILMLTSSLLYECTLLSRSNSRAHPKAPYPIEFLCTSLDQDARKFRNLPAKNEAEAEMLVARALEFIKTWPLPQDGTRPTIGLLASTRQQVSCLRQKFRQKTHGNLLCDVDIKPTYLIQGEEFSAIFLSTWEPTDKNGIPRDPVRSICNKHVFNTLVTRAQSLVFSAGNPFLLHHMGTSEETNCWAEYIYRCIQCQTLLLPEVKTDADVNQLPKAVEQLFRKVFPAESLNEATQLSLKTQSVDDIVKQYISDLQVRPEYRRVHKLIQGPKGRTTWEVESNSGSEEQDDRVVLCRIECKNFHEVVAVPTDGDEPPIHLDSYSSRKLAFHGDTVRVDVAKRCVLLDEETEKAVRESHFGESFLCKVDSRSPTMFLPLDRRHPKFANLPTLTRSEVDGVVCFDPRSINNRPKMNNFIPMECARKMLFIVKFLGWHERFNFPLGIIVGALPPGHSPILGDTVLRIANNIPLVQCSVVSPQPPICETDSTVSEVDRPRLTDALTIDPKGSPDHDDALTCTRIKKQKDTEVYEIGVHITNVHKYLPKGSPLDEAARERGCSVYRAPDDCISSMLPEDIVQATSICEGEPRDVFSVLLQVTLVNGAVHKLHDVTITESQVTSTLEFTYPEAQALILPSASLQPPRLLRFTRSQRPGTPSIQEKLQTLWKVASFLRNQRLGKAAYSFANGDPEDEDHPEAHFLVEEFMIWTNQQVAKRLVTAFPDYTVLRTQAKPNQEQLSTLVKEHGPSMHASLALQMYTPREQHPCRSIHMLHSVLTCIQNELRRGNIRQALHYIQFEHLHPQLAVAHSLFHNTQSPSNYCVSTKNEKNYWHDTLRCNQYTHFTSPIRRYIDIVAQRLLHAALNGLQSPYSRKELEEISEQCKTAVKRANNYEHEINRLGLANELLQSSKEFVCFVAEIKEGKLYLCFSDGRRTRVPAIQLRDLNASNMETSAENPTQVFKWEVKVVSFHGTPQKFLTNARLEPCTSEESGTAMAHINLFVADTGGPIQMDSHLVERKLPFKIKSSTCTIPLQVWKEVQTCIERDPKTLNASSLLSKLPPTNDRQDSPSNVSLRSNSALWIYTIQRPMQPCEVMTVQLSASRREQTLTPCVQLLEVGPGLSVCIQHSVSPAECFTDKLTENASKRQYRSVGEYFQQWEKVLLADAAHNSIKESELLVVRDVILTWPRLAKQTNSSGHVYYQLHIPEGKRDAGVHITLSKSFIDSSYVFFKFSEGDLACVRYNIPNSGTTTRSVFHMVVHHVDRKQDLHSDLTEITVYLKFIGPSSNYISIEMEQFLRNSHKVECELQLIPLTLPYRRIYRSLHDFTMERSPLAEIIALGKGKMNNRNPLNVRKILTQEAVSIATSLWPLQPVGSGNVELNKYQQKAVDLACSNPFTLIQGPPGTGKSVTGAHIAYALAMKLRQDPRRQPVSSRQPRQCVMYCGPSQQSVNVVLDMLTSKAPAAVKDTLKIIRVYSKAIERKDFTGPKSNSKVFPHEHTDSKCDPKHRDYALHYLTRRRNPKIAALEEEFKQLNRVGKIPSQKKRENYRSLVSSTEMGVLRDGADIVLCTCNEASSHRVMQSLKPVYCIIDECAMATEPECMVPIRRAEHVVLIGDHCQLQPIIQYRDAEVMGLGQSLFQRYVEKIEVHPHMLQAQYRMHPALCKFPSEEFYDGKLSTDPSVSDQRQQDVARLNRFWPKRGKPFLFCDVIGKEKVDHTGQKGSGGVGQESKYNVEEAIKITSILKELTGRRHGVRPCEIAVLTPYSAQRREIRRQMQKQGVEGIEVKTITDSQGSEYGIVLLSTVRSKPKSDITTVEGEKKAPDFGWLRANLGFITDRHQICVGITRCKYGLVIVGNKLLLSYDPTWNRLIEHYRKNGCIRRSGEFPPAQ